jgi:hypothetical protein
MSPPPRHRCRVVIPVLNQLPYTQQCVESLLAAGTPASALLVIDNGSSDETPAWLASRPDVPSIRNRVNLGCGGAWAQGALHDDSDWVLLLNNDVVVCPDFVDGLLDAAERHGLDVVSPALVEGPLDYDFAELARRFREAMQGSLRRGWFHGVAFAVHRRVFEAIGFPDTDRQLGGREGRGIPDPLPAPRRAGRHRRRRRAAPLRLDHAEGDEARERARRPGRPRRISTGRWAWAGSSASASRRTAGAWRATG